MIRTGPAPNGINYLPHWNRRTKSIARQLELYIEVTSKKTLRQLLHVFCIVKVEPTFGLEDSLEVLILRGEQFKVDKIGAVGRFGVLLWCVRRVCRF